MPYDTPYNRSQLHMEHLRYDIAEAGNRITRAREELEYYIARQSILMAKLAKITREDS
jgi:hypothetical protein